MKYRFDCLSYTNVAGLGTRRTGVWAKSVVILKLDRTLLEKLVSYSYLKFTPKICVLICKISQCHMPHPDYLNHDT